MNDPNGLIFYEGEMHLFYQALPSGEGGKCWGHAVSTDAVTREHLSTALEPDEIGHIWSGGMVADDDNTSGFFDGDERGGLVAIFTHLTPEPAQAQSLAYSRDRGRTWTKYTHNPVLTSNDRDFRDPKVFWHEEKRRWTMILAVGDRAEIYRSPDLKTWTLASEFGRERTAGYGMWECPDLFALRVPGDDRERWVFTSSFVAKEGPIGRCETRYWVGHFDGERFEADGEQPRLGRLLDHGPDHYASILWNNYEHLGSRRELSLQILVDRCSVEVFTQDGRTVLTALIFPAADSQRLEFFARDGAAQIEPHTLTLHALGQVEDGLRDSRDLSAGRLS